MCRKILFVLVFNIVGFIAANTSATESISSNKLTLSEENLILAEVYISKNDTGQVIEIYQYDGGYLVPMGLLNDILEFPVDVDINEKAARGWFIKENRIFDLDIGAGEVVVEGVKTKLDKRMITTSVNDIYVDSSLYSQWFPVDLDLNFSDLILIVKPREELPVQSRMDREQVRNKALRTGKKENNYETIRQPYKPYDMPFLDVDLGYDYSSTNNPANQISYSALAQGDIAYQTTSLAVVGNSTGALTGLRLNAGRSDYQGGLLGKMNAKSYLAGDITAVPISLVSTRSSGRGVTISNADINRADQFDSTNFVGDSQPGWEVEIYRNGVLLDFQVVGDDGRYEFNDVPIYFGNNVFRIVSYGPQGQVREKVQTYLIDNSILKKGQFNYQISADQKSRTIFGVDEGTQTVLHRPGERYVADFDYGITDNMTARVGYVRTPLEDNRVHEYQSIGIRNSFTNFLTAGMLTEYNFVYDDVDGSYATEILANARVKDINVRARQAFYDNFVSEVERATSQRRTSTSQLDLDGRFDNIVPSGISYRITGRYEAYEQSRQVTTISNRLSTSMRGIGLTNNLQFSSTKDGDSNTTLTNGTFSVRGRYRGISLRLSTDYDVDPAGAFKNLDLTAQKQLTIDSNARVTIRKDLVGDNTTSINTSWNKRYKYFTHSVIGSADDQSNFTAGTKISFAIGREPRQGRWFMDDKDMSNNGAVSAHAFLDNNYNDVYDDGDESLENVGYIARSGKFKGDKDFPVVIPRVEPYIPSPVEIDYSTLEDPFWVPKTKGYNVVPRPGVFTKLDFPVYVTTEIDGMVYLQQSGAQEPLPRADVELVDKKGEAVQTVRSEFDGFYIFENVVPGKYTVRIGSKTIGDMQASNKPQEKLYIKDGSDTVSGIDLVVEK